MRFTSVVLLIGIGISALVAGYSFMIEPTGKDIGISLNYLRPWVPFQTFLLPGIILFIFNGVLSLFVATLAMKKVKSYPLLIQLQGCVIVAWIVVQLTMVASIHPLHFALGFIGGVLILCGRLLNRRRRLTIP